MCSLTPEKPVTEMVERVARALATAEGGKISGPARSVATREFGWDIDGQYLRHYVERHWREHTVAASMAIDAMREPTDEMVQAGRRGAPYDRDCALTWPDMIDKARGV